MPSGSYMYIFSLTNSPIHPLLEKWAVGEMRGWGLTIGGTSGAASEGWRAASGAEVFATSSQKLTFSMVNGWNLLAFRRPSAARIWSASSPPCGFGGASCTIIIAGLCLAPASSIAFSGAFSVGQSRAKWPALSHRKHLRSLTSTCGCRHSLAVCPFLLQLMHVMLVRERGGEHRSGPQGQCEPELQHEARNAGALLGRASAGGSRSAS